MENYDDCPKLPWMIDFHCSENSNIPKTQLNAAFAASTMEFLTSLSIKSQVQSYRATQIMCTVSPNVTCKTIEELMGSGMSIARIHLPTFSSDLAKELLTKIRTKVTDYSKKIRRIFPLAIALEIRGPDIRTGQLKDYGKKEITLERGKITHLTTDRSFEEFVSEDMIYVDYQKLHEVIQPGDKILLDNGSVTLSAIEVAESIVRCLVEKAGNLISNASVTLLNTPNDLPLLTKSDMEILQFSIEQNIDGIIVSGVASRESILRVRGILGNSGEHILIFAKIENSRSIENVDDLIKVSDGIIIDCERLVGEIPREKVFIIQKSILAKCNMKGKPAFCSVYVADIKSVSKSEICDVANVVMDGADGLIVHQESTTKQVVQVLSDICREAEPSVYQKQLFNDLKSEFIIPMEPIYSLAMSVVEASLKTNAGAIICLTCSGRTAKLLSRFRPRCPIITITRYPRIARQMKFYRGIEPVLYLKAFGGDFEEDVSQRIQVGISFGKYVKYIKTGDAVVTIAASRPGSGLANTMQVIYASDFDVN